MSNLRFFHVNAVIGEPLYSGETGQFGCYVGPEDLLAEMDYCGVECALVSHWDAMKVHPSMGNERLLEQLRGQRRLFPCWVVLPHHTGESPEPKRLLAEMGRNDVRAVRLLPGLFHFSLADWSAGELLEALEYERILTIIDAEPAELHSLCERYPDLPVVSTNSELRFLYPLLSQHPNLYVSMEGPSHPDMIEDICQRFGAGRLLFGSPHVPPVFPTHNLRDEPGAWRIGPSVAVVAYARISREEKEKVAGGNLRSLLHLEQEPVALPAPESAIVRAGWAGHILPVRVLDAHFHLGPWMYTYHPGTSVAAALAMMDAAGVERICISSSAAVAGGDHYRGNEEIAAACRQHLDRFIGIGVINPHFPNTEAEIRRCLEGFGFRGLKVHPRTHQCELSDPKYEPVWRASERYGVLVQAHTGERQTGASPRAFDAIAAEYPRGKFLLIHSGDNLEGLRLCLDIAERRPNVYLGTSDVAFMYVGMLEYAVKRVGAERIVFESDCSTINFNHSLGIVLYSRLSDKDKVLGLNLAKLMEL